MVSFLSKNNYVVQVDDEPASIPKPKFWTRRRTLIALCVIFLPVTVVLLYLYVDIPSESSSTPYPQYWAANLNYTIYAGPTNLGLTTLETRQNWTEIRLIDRRWDSTGGHQQLEQNYFCGEYGTCCIFNDCEYVGNEIPTYQIGDCHIFYNGATIWEWYPWLEKCAKIFSGVGMVTPTWWEDSEMIDPVGWDTISQPADVTKDQSCYEYRGIGNMADQSFWIHSDGTPCKHLFGSEDYSSGVDMYDDWVVTPELTDPFEMPSYCPDIDSDPVLEIEIPNQIYICTGYWFDDEDRSKLERLKKTKKSMRAEKS